jgi:hypothetical protein
MRWSVVVTFIVLTIILIIELPRLLCIKIHRNMVIIIILCSFTCYSVIAHIL